MRIWARAAARLAVALAFTMFVMTACASPERSAESPVSDDQPDVVLCQGNEVPVQALEDPRPASELAPDTAPALDGRGVSDFDPLDWLIAQEGNDRVMLMDKLAVPTDDGRGDIREYMYIVISTDSMPAGPSESEWAVVESSTCSPMLDLGELHGARVALDPSSSPPSVSDRIALLVTEFACNSGQDAAGRVELVELAETESTVELVIGVRPSDAQEASCQGNPATPFIVELEQPLADRVILNAAVVPARELITSTVTTGKSD